MTYRAPKPTRRRIAQALNAYASMSEKPDAPRVKVRAERGEVQHTDESRLEGSVIHEVSKLLHRHPNVIFAVRQNGGSAPLVGKGGAMVPVWFYRLLRMPVDMTLTDFWGFTRRGPFALEAKRRDWKFTGTLRETQQQAFISMVREAGGCGGFVTCAEDAMAILKEAA